MFDGKSKEWIYIYIGKINGGYNYYNGIVLDYIGFKWLCYSGNVDSKSWVIVDIRNI